MNNFLIWFRFGFSVGSVPAGVHAWRFRLGSSFRSAMICGGGCCLPCGGLFCPVYGFYMISLSILAFSGLRSLCGRSMACGLS